MLAASACIRCSLVRRAGIIGVGLLPPAVPPLCRGSIDCKGIATQASLLRHLPSRLMPRSASSNATAVAHAASASAAAAARRCICCGGLPGLQPRRGATHALAALARTRGYSHAAVINFVALLGWTNADEDAVFGLAQLTQEFSLGKARPVPFGRRRRPRRKGDGFPVRRTKPLPWIRTRRIAWVGCDPAMDSRVRSEIKAPARTCPRAHAANAHTLGCRPDARACSARVRCSVRCSRGGAGTPRACDGRPYQARIP